MERKGQQIMRYREFLTAVDHWVSVQINVCRIFGVEPARLMNITKETSEDEPFFETWLRSARRANPEKIEAYARSELRNHIFKSVEPTLTDEQRRVFNWEEFAELVDTTIDTVSELLRTETDFSAAV